MSDKYNPTTRIVQLPGTYPGGTPVHAYTYDADADVGDTVATYTVTAGKKFYVYYWGVGDNSYGTYELRVDGVAKDAILNASSSGGQRGINSVSYPVPLEATAGQVVSIYKSAGLSNKITASMINGIEMGV